jgi:hypothetical protein
MAWEARYEGRRSKADLGPNGRTTSKMHFSRREWTGDRPDHGHKTERYGVPFAKPLHLTVVEARLSEGKCYNGNTLSRGAHQQKINPQLSGWKLLTFRLYSLRDSIDNMSVHLCSTLLTSV